MRAESEIMAEIARLDGVIREDPFAPADRISILLARLWALKWALGEER